MRVVVLTLLLASIAPAASADVDSFGPTPQDCGVLGRDYADPTCTTQTRNGTFAFSAHIVHAGGTLSGTITNRCKQGPQQEPCPIGWAGVTALGKPTSGCATADAQCTVRIPKRAETTKWLIVTVGITSDQGTGISKDYVAIVGEGKHLLSGHVRDDHDQPVKGVRIVAGRERRKTDATGYYSVLLKRGRYRVRTTRDGVTPVKSRDCVVDGFVCLVRMSRDRRANFTTEGPLRYLAINVGNAYVRCYTSHWENKLCMAKDVQSVRSYIARWKPDVIMLSEIWQKDQLTGSAGYGPVLPAGWKGRCGASVNRDTGDPAGPLARDASHEHECVAWNADRLSYVTGSALSAYGRNDADGRKQCNYDFTGFRVRLLLGTHTITAVAVHPNSTNAFCRTDEIKRYWSQLADGPMTIIGGDFNTADPDELVVPGRFRVNYSLGKHWNEAPHDGECTATYRKPNGCKQFDHAFSTFGDPCTDCGAYYGTPDVEFGAALGGYHGHPRADGGNGMDHRQILVDMHLSPATEE